MFSENIIQIKNKCEKTETEFKTKMI